MSDFTKLYDKVTNQFGAKRHNQFHPKIGRNRTGAARQGGGANAPQQSANAQHMEITQQQDATRPVATPTAKQPNYDKMPIPDFENGQFLCPACKNPFKSPQAYRVHYIRTHTGRAWDTTKNFTKNKQVGRPKGSKSSKPRNPSRGWTSEQYELVRKIVASQPNGMIHWDLLMQKHPDWAKVLTFDTTPRNVFQSFVGRARWGSYNKKTRKYDRGEKPVVTPAAPPPEQQLRLSTITFCPYCGKNVAVHNAAANIEL